jgi:hypothetical protein
VGPSADATLEKRLPGYRFEVVLLLLFATFMVMASAPSGAWARPVITGLQGATLVAAFLAARVSRRLLRIAIVVALAAFASAVVAAVAGVPGGNGPFLLLDVLVVGAVPVVIARSVWRRGVVDARTILAAVCIYITIGMLWAFIYGVISEFGTGPFFAQTSHATTADLLYFSFVTLTTVGYGDFTARGDLGRAVAVLEALFGQLYLVTVIAVLVSRMALHRRPGSDPPADGGGA